MRPADGLTAADPAVQYVVMRNSEGMFGFRSLAAEGKTLQASRSNELQASTIWTWILRGA